MGGAPSPDRLGLVARILARFASATGPELDDEIHRALQEIAQAGGLEHAYLVLLDPSLRAWSMTHEWCAPGIPEQRAALQDVDVESYGWSAARILEGRTIRIDRLDDYPPEAAFDRASSESYGSRSLLLQPLHGRGGSVVAAIGLETLTREHAWSDDDVTLLRTIGDVLANVLERRRAEEALRASESRLQAITALSPDIISILDSTGRLVFNSPASSRIHGWDPEDLVGRNTMDLWHPDDRQVAAERLAALVADPASVQKVQYRYRNKDGSWTWMEAVASNQLGNPLLRGIVVVSRDIGDRKRDEEVRLRLDQRVQQAQKLESLAVLAGGIAHDFNNLLVAILGNLELTLADLPETSHLRPNLFAAQQASHRAAELARQMLAYSGRARFQVGLVDLDELLADMVRVLEVSISKDAELRITRTPGLPAVNADAAQLRQVAMNLILNASESLGSGIGQIRVGTGVMDCDRAYLSGTWLDEDLPEGRYVFLEVADTGSGMDAATVARIFEPFFTTKFAGRGLGLAAVLGIVRGHRGAIRVSSVPGRGTTFRVLLPAAEAPAPGVEPDPDRPAQPAPRGVVLLVDDDAPVREVGRKMLERLGYTPVLAASGTEALAWFRDDPGASAGCRAVLLDLAMPQLDGVETFRALRAVRPDLAVILSSGFTEEDAMGRFSGVRPAAFLQKPWGIEELAAVIERVGIPGR